MGILQRNLEERLEYFEVKEGEKSACRIPAFPNMRMDIFVRCPNPVDLSVVSEDGQIMLLDSGKIVRWSGRMKEGTTAVEIVADTGFWYLCQKAPLFEFNDGIPLKVEIVQTEADVLRMMIDERLRRWKSANEINRELTDEETEELILDIASGDLEFDERPDEFGLGYEERLKEFVAKQVKQDAAPEPAPEPVPAPENVVPPAPIAEGSTVRST